MSEPSPPTSPLRARIEATAIALRARAPLAAPPRVGIVLGSGLGAFADSLQGVVKVPYGDLPHLPTSGVLGHAGNFCFGTVGDVPVVCMQGRVHAYEGHALDACVHGVRVMAHLGVEAVLLTNAAGGVEPTWSPGDLMVIEDHLNFTATNPLTGPNHLDVGPRFPDLTRAYDPDLRAAVLDVARAEGLTLRSGVYAWLTGPTYETPSEVRMLRMLGAHAVGMSTVPEVIALCHMGVRVGALSCITNLAAGITGDPLSHAEVESVARTRRADLLKLLGGWVKRV